MKTKLLNFYMNMAEMASTMSYSKKLKVGCIIVNDERVVSYSWNGTPSGWDNECEVRALIPAGMCMNNPKVYSDDFGHYTLETSPYIIHAESNAISKLAKSNESGKDAVMFCTHSPCLECAKLIYQSGIKELYYHETFNKTEGIDFLKYVDINVEQL